MIRAALRLSAYLLFTLGCMPVQFWALRFRPSFTKTFPVWYHRNCLKIFGITVEQVGSPSAHKPCLFVSNHCSYLDIPVISSLMPISFVAKAEVNNWPLFGTLARLQGTLFIDRRLSKVNEGQTALAKRLDAGDSLMLFPEGTSSDGTRVLPFRRALLQTALDQAGSGKLVIQPVSIVCQPVSIVCTSMLGLPADRSDRQVYAWFGDMDLLPHLWAYCNIRTSTIRVTFHEPIDVASMSDRAVLANTAENLVAQGIAA